MRRAALNKPAEQPKASKAIWLQEIFPVMQETLDAGGSFRLTVTGSSMVPTLLGGRDCVTLVKPPETLQKGDLPLYRRRNGAFVLHRVVAVAEDGSYVLCGDHQWVKEPGIRQEQIVGLVSEIERKGKQFTVDNRRYRRWVRFWIRALPMRHALFRIHGLPAAFKRRILRKKVKQ